MAIPDSATGWSLQDVVNEVIPSTDDLNTCFTEAEPSFFHPDYEGTKTRLSNFRAYGATAVHGLLYNYFAAGDTRFCPTDWRIPTIAEYQSLVTAMGTDSGSKLAGGIANWKYIDNGITTSSSFGNSGMNIPGAGRRLACGEFESITEYGYIWSSTIATGAISARTALVLQYLNTSAIANSGTLYTENEGLSVRLIYTGSGTPTTVADNDGNNYDVILVNGKYWTAQNWKSTTYANGDAITRYDKTEGYDWYNTTSGGYSEYIIYDSSAFDVLVEWGSIYVINTSATSGFAELSVVTAPTSSLFESRTTYSWLHPTDNNTTDKVTVAWDDAGIARSGIVNILNKDYPCEVAVVTVNQSGATIDTNPTASYYDRTVNHKSGAFTASIDIFPTSGTFSSAVSVGDSSWLFRTDDNINDEVDISYSALSIAGSRTGYVRVTNTTNTSSYVDINVTQTAYVVQYTLEDQNGDPITDAILTVDGTSKTTDGNGQNYFVLGAGSYSWNSSKSGYVSTTGTSYITSNASTHTQKVVAIKYQMLIEGSTNQYTLTPTSSEGNSGTLSFTVSPDTTVSISDDATWITTSINNTTDTFVITWTANTDIFERIGIVTLNNIGSLATNTVRVTQAGTAL